MISFSLCPPPSGCVFQSLFSPSFSHQHQHPFCPHIKDTVNYLHHIPSTVWQALFPSSSSSPVLYWTRYRLIYSQGSTPCCKVFKHRWMLWGGPGEGRGTELWLVGWIHDTHSAPLLFSNSQYTLAYNRNTGVIYPPCFITSWLSLIYTPAGLATGQPFFRTVSLCLRIFVSNKSKYTLLTWGAYCYLMVHPMRSVLFQVGKWYFLTTYSYLTIYNFFFLREKKKFTSLLCSLAMQVAQIKLFAIWNSQM